MRNARAVILENHTPRIKGISEHAREGYNSRFVCLSVFLSVCLSVCFSVCLSVYLFTLASYPGPFTRTVRAGRSDISRSRMR